MPSPPVVLPLRQERANKQPTREAQHGDEELDADESTCDPDPPLPEGDLHLVTRGGLEGDGRELPHPRDRRVGSDARCSIRSSTSTPCEARSSRPTTALPCAGLSRSASATARGESSRRRASGSTWTNGIVSPRRYRRTEFRLTPSCCPILDLSDTPRLQYRHLDGWECHVV